MKYHDGMALPEMPNAPAKPKAAGPKPAAAKPEQKKREPKVFQWPKAPPEDS